MSSSSSSSGISLSESSCGEHTKGLAIVGVKKMIKRDDLFPSCFEITSSQAQYKFTVYLRKSPQGVGLKLKSVEGKVVIRGFQDHYKELQADVNNDLQKNDVIISVDHWDVEAAGFSKVVSELKWTVKDQRKADEMRKERKRFKDDNYTGPMNKDCSAFLDVHNTRNSNHGEVFTCVQIARVLIEDDDEVSYYEDERN